MFPNANKGVKRLFIAEILSCAAALMLLVLSLVLLAKHGENGGSSEMLTLLPLLPALVGIVALVFRTLGVIDAAKDERAFRLAKYAIFGSLALAAVKTVLSQIGSAGKIADVIEFAYLILGLVSTVFIIMGIRNLADRMNRPDVSKFGRILLILIGAGLAVGCVAALIVIKKVDSAALTDPATTLKLAVISAAGVLVEDAVLLFYVYKGKNMFEQS